MGYMPRIREEYGARVGPRPHVAERRVVAGARRKLLALASDREGTRALGLRGAEGVRHHHSIARMADRALEVYRSVVQRPVGAGTES